MQWNSFIYNNACLLKPGTDTARRKRLVKSIVGSALIILQLGMGNAFAVAEVEDLTCGEGLEEPLLGNATTIDAIGDQRALFIFARFPDGMDIEVSTNPEINGDDMEECENCGESWTVADSTNLPAWADSLLEDTVPPTKPGSLSHYFFEMSNGQHVLKGQALSTVVESDTLIQWYRQPGVLADLRRANRHILQKVAAESLVNFADFDLAGGAGGAPDSVVDYVFIFWQSVRTKFMLGDSLVVRSFPGASISSLITSPLSVNGVTISLNSGATIFPQQYQRPVQNRFMARHRWVVSPISAHEYGHDLKDLAAVSSNCDSHHITTESRYGLMNGSMTPPVMMMSGLMRYKLEWIDPPIIPFPSCFPFDSTLTLSASYEDQDGCFAIVQSPAADPEQYFMLEARKSGIEGQVYNDFQPAGQPSCCYPMRDVGDGLLISHVRDEGACCYDSELAPPLLDIEVATGRFNPGGGVGFPDPVAGLTRLALDSRAQCDSVQYQGPWTGRAGDLFQPRDGAYALFSNAFTPFTCPSTNLYEDEDEDPPYPQTVYSGISIYDIEWVAGEDSMRVKLHIDDPSIVPSAADTLRTDMTWDGLVQLTADLVVREGVKLTIEEGSVVVARAEHDRLGDGADDERVELTTLGQLDVQGTEEDSVSFVSSFDEGFREQEFRSWAPDSTNTASAGDWYGLRFDLAGCECTGYGYSTGLGEPSSVEHATIKYARRGISIENYVAPNIVGVNFAGTSENDNDVYLDSTDVFIPYGYWNGPSCYYGGFVEERGRWDLIGGTHVVAANAAAQDASCLGVVDKVDLVPYGLLNTSGSTATGDSVFFRPENPTDPADEAAGRDWGGITMGYESSGSSIRFADIGFASNPLYFWYPDSSSIARSRIHDFAEMGLWVHGCMGDGIEVDSVTVERGDALHASLGEVGIYFDQVDQGSLEKSMISLEGYDGESGAIGLAVRFGKTFCEADPDSGRTLLVEKNLVVGPGVLAGALSSGVETNWVCGSDLRTVDLVNNWVGDWSDVGLNLIQTADVQVSCNKVQDVKRGADIWRDSDPTGTSIRMRENRIEALEQDSTYFAVRTNDAGKTKLGPNTAEKGKNELAVNVDDTKFIYEADPDSTDELNAKDNYWFTWNGASFSQVDNVILISDIEDRLAPSGWQIDFSSFETSAPSSDCDPPNPSARIGRAETLTIEGESQPVSINEPGIPLAFSLGNAHPNPGRETVSLDLAVPADRVGEYRLAAYDVRGGKVFEAVTQIRQAGRYRLEWNGRENSGMTLGSGVYFLRLDGPAEVLAFRKVVFLR